MKIGILTFVNGLNYGAKLQCWALKTALESYGCDVCVFDNRVNYKSTGFKEVLSSRPRSWVKFFISLLYGFNMFDFFTRIRRTICFVERMSLTPYCFTRWSDAPVELGVDLIVVGSDQVWHCGDWGDPAMYLLEGAPNVKAISYAASFGMKNIPNTYIEMYKKGFKRFSAISCREKEGVKICQQFGFNATHVVDPTILLDRWRWLKLVGDVKKEQKIFCYFLCENVEQALPSLDVFAKKMDCKVYITVNYDYTLKRPASFLSLLCNWRLHPRIKVCHDFGPIEFVKSIASASWVITDSFHALMFASIFNCNVRFLKPLSFSRESMFARIIEFANECIVGPLVAADLQHALYSIESGESVSFNQNRISKMRSYAYQWIRNTITSLKNKV